MSHEPESLDAKRKRLAGLANVIKLHSRVLSKGERAAVDELQERLDFRLKELVDEAQSREADIKIEVFTAIIEIIRIRKPIYEQNVTH